MLPSLGQWWVRLARRGSGGDFLRLWPLLVGREVLPVILGAKFWTGFFHPLLVAPSLEAPQRGSCRLVDCLASLWAGVCGLPCRWRVATRVLMVVGFPLLRAWRSTPSHIPWPFLDLTSVLSRCQILAWLVSWGWWLVLG